jgi:hypothetical protein
VDSAADGATRGRLSQCRIAGLVAACGGGADGFVLSFAGRGAARARLLRRFVLPLIHFITYSSTR